VQAGDSGEEILDMYLNRERRSTQQRINTTGLTL
jgi:hypothetical protein